ncbi:MAG: DUF374 domain-containing protein [Deltaproteobacteria bacterium]|nr:DUF374 domain-containing protein [Deltaproteobacteria bacterium]
MSWLRALARRVVGELLLLAFGLFRLTWRVRVVGQVPEGPAVYAFWHGDLLCLAAASPPTRAAVLVSRSPDGELGGLLARHLGCDAVRGSTSRGAWRSALGLRRRLRAGQAVALALDGPRGPRHRDGSSATRLARAAGVPLVPVAARASRAWQLRSWDRLCIPRPFATVVVAWGAPAAECEAAGALAALWERTRRETRV